MEMLACVFGGKTFHSCLYEYKFTWSPKTITATSSSLCCYTQTCNRIKCWAMTLSIYWWYTSTHGNANALSRLSVPDLSKDPPVPTCRNSCRRTLKRSYWSKTIKLWTLYKMLDVLSTPELNFTGWEDKKSYCGVTRDEEIKNTQPNMASYCGVTRDEEIRILYPRWHHIIG